MESKLYEECHEGGGFMAQQAMLKQDETVRTQIQGYLNRYGLEGWGRERYATLPVKAGACVECGACETRCPYNLPIRSMMKKAAEDFGE